jgi:exopolyphosphatase/guanosine-5'-triphosphate,3'-diphosphate pyrophosphatase
VDELVGVMTEFRRVAASKRADKVYVFATEAMRSAKNHSNVLKRIKAETGIVVDLITPQREAELSFLGVRLDTKEVEPGLMFEVGGGSAQVAVVTPKKIVEEVSLPLGTGRIIAESGIQNPCPLETKEKAKSYIGATLKACRLNPKDHAKAIVSGGVARGLWRALHPDGDKRLLREELEYLIWATERLSVERIIERFNVKPKRAGTLLPGALVYHALMEKFGLAEIMVSEFGVREGAVLEMAGGRVKGQTP